MKKLILIVAFAGFLSSSYAQSMMAGDVPVAVTKAFTRTHPKTDAVEWNKVGDFYKASYKADTRNASVTYTTKGKLKETEMEISVASLPTAVIKYLNENHPAETVKKASKVTSAAGKTIYNVRIKDMDMSFGSNGKILK